MKSSRYAYLLLALLACLLACDKKAPPPPPPPIHATASAYAGPIISSQSFGTKGDGVADDTAAFQTAVASTPPGYILVIPPPSVTYKVTSAINVTTPNIVLSGLVGMGSVYQPVFTQYTYGSGIFNVTATHVVLEHLSGQYGPTTTLAAPVSVGAGSLTVASSAGISVNDWLVLDQASATLQDLAPMEQCQVSGVSGVTVSLSSCGAGNTTSATTLYAHASGAWVRDQATVGGNSIQGQPPRNYAGLVSFSTGDECGVDDAGVLAMVTGLFFRGVPSSNATNNYANWVDHVHTAFTQFAVLAQQQTGFRVSNEHYENATEGQATAPGHGLYMTGLIGLSGTWLNGKTYNLYDQVSFSGVQYISRQGSNLGNEPDISPTFWSAQTVPTSSTGWRSKNLDLRVNNVFASPGANFKDWSAVKIKFTDGAVVNNFVAESAVRGFDLQECDNCTMEGVTMRDFVPPVSSDSSAAAMTLLDCNQTTIADAVINLTQNSSLGAIGDPIDMPVVLDRVDGTVDPVTSVPLGHDNTFANLAAWTNYDSSFTSAAFRIQTLRAHLLSLSENDSGGQNPYAFYFAQNTTAGTFANGGVLQRPVTVGTTHIAQVSTGTTSSYWDIDNNLLDCSATASCVWNDANGIVTTNRLVTNVAGTETFSPTSTSSDVIDIVLPGSYSGKLLNATNSVGNTEWSVSDSAGVKQQNTASNTSGGFYCGGSNATGGYPSTSNTILAIAPVVNGGTSGLSCGTANAEIAFTAAENQGAAAWGTDLRLYTEAPGTTTQSKNMRLYGGGDVSLNDSNSAVATNATQGFTFLPNMAGAPSGTPTHAPGGTTATVVDTTDQTIWTRFGSLWQDIKALAVAASGPAGGTTFNCSSFQRVSSSQSGNSYTIPSASACPGSRVTIECTNAGGLYTFSLTPSSGTIDGNASYALVAQKATTTVTLISDGSNWWTDKPTPTLSTYAEDSPGYHGYFEWNGNPAFIDTKTSMVSQTVYLQRIQAQVGGTLNNINVIVGTLGSGFSAATTTNVTGAVSSGGLIQLSVASTAGLATGNVATVSGVTGTTEANGAWVLTSVASPAGTVTLQGSTFTNNYIAGGTLTLSSNLAAVFDSGGNFLTATGDQTGVWNTTGGKAMPVATTKTITRGGVYYVALLFNGSATTLAFETFASSASFANQGITGAFLRWATNGTSATVMPSSITPSSNSVTGAITNYVSFN